MNASTVASTGLRLSLLGPAAWSSGAGHAAPLERRDAGMLAYLAIEGPTPRTRLVELLWPDTDDQVARNHFRQRLHRLKKAAGADLLHGAEMLSVAASVAIDLHAAPPFASIELLAGLDYSDCPQFDAWLMQQRTRVRRLHMDALAAAAAEHENAGRLAEAIALAEQLAAVAPLEEAMHRRLMRLHYLQGDRAAALAAFEHCERVIRAELGSHPGAETIALLETIQSATVVAAARTSLAAQPALVRPPRTIGRDTEIAAALAGFDAERVVLVLGAGGLGKSRLLAELDMQSPGAITIRARPGDAAVPYALLARWLRAIDRHDAAALASAPPEWLAALLPERAPASAAAPVTTAVVRSACERVVAACAASVSMCCVDDLHHADAASLELLRHLILLDPAPRWRWALARRPDEGSAAANDLAAALADAHKLVVIRLTPLARPQIAELVDTLSLPDLVGARLAEPLARHTGGNPLFILETIKQALLGGGLDEGRLPRPLGVIEAIERRLAGLSPAAQQLVQVGAVAGEDFSVKLAAAVLGAPALSLAHAWRELEAAQFIDGTAFVHDLVQEAVLAWVPHPLRRHLCGAVAGVLAAEGADAARIAELWLAAGDYAQAAPALVAAAAAARRAGRFVEAGERCEQAARAYDRLGRENESFAQLHHALDDFSTTTSRDVVARLATELDARARGDAQCAVAGLARAQVANLAGDWRGMQSALDAALAAAQRCGNREYEAEARFGLGVVLHYHGETADAIEQIGAATQLLDALGVEPRLAEMRGSLARVLYLVGRVKEAGDQLDKAIAVLRGANVLNELAADVGFGAQLALETGDLPRALELSRQSHVLMAQAEAGAHEWLTAMGDRLRVLATAARYDEALELIAAVRADRRFSPMPAQARFIETEAAILFELGRGSHAERLLAPLAQIDGGAVGYRASRAVVALQGHGLQGRPVTPAGLQEARGLVASVPQRCRFAAVAAPLLACSEAVQLCASALELAEGLGLKGHVPGLLAGQAHALHRAAQDDEARRHARRAMRVLETTAPLVYRGSIWLLLHDTLAAAGDAAGAREVLLQAGEWLHHTARCSVPAVFRDSFLARNAVNRALVLLSSKVTIARLR